MDTYGEWPDYVEEVVSGMVWLLDPFCPGPENIWVEEAVMIHCGLVWRGFKRRENGCEAQGSTDDEGREARDEEVPMCMSSGVSGQDLREGNPGLEQD